MKDLNCYNKGITSIKGISIFKNLRVLDIDSIQFTTFPEEVLNLKELTSYSLFLNKGLDNIGQPIYQKIDLPEMEIADWETGKIIIPKEALEEEGQYELRFGHYSNSWGETRSYFTYNFNIVSLSNIDLSFSGLPTSVTVGDTFTLATSRDDQTGSTGWTWDAKGLDATFNSPATFTAKKAGKTVISYITAEGYEIKAELDVKAKTETSVVKASTNAPATGDQSNTSLYVIMLIMSGAYVLVKKYRRA